MQKKKKKETKNSFSKFQLQINIIPRKVHLRILNVISCIVLTDMEILVTFELKKTNYANLSRGFIKLVDMGATYRPGIVGTKPLETCIT